MSEAEKRNSLRFYQGDTEHYEVEEGAGFNWPFYEIKRAYNILNVLMYPGMGSEYARFSKEAKKIPYHLLDYLDEIIKVYNDIFFLMCKNMKSSGEKIHLYRAERMQAMEMIEAGHTYSFTSCSLVAAPEEYLTKKDGILLLELDMPLSIPHVSVNSVLGENKFAYQEEILLPPFVSFIEATKKKLTEDELRYRDIKGESPKTKYSLTVSDNWKYSEKTSVDLVELKDGCEQVKKVLKRVKEEETVSSEEEEFYCRWKTKFQTLIKIMFDEIYRKNSQL